MNNWSFTGSLGRDAQTRDAGSSTVTQFSVAVRSGYGTNEVTTWVNANLWGKRGQSLEPHLLKGQQVAIVGELTNRPYKTKEGVEKFSLEVNVSDLTLIGAKAQGGSSQITSQKNNSSGSQASSFDDFSDDIPFANPYRGRNSYLVM